jgi:hypothetical protein
MQFTPVFLMCGITPLWGLAKLYYVPIVIAVLTLADSLTPQHSSTVHAMLMENAHLQQGGCQSMSGADASRTHSMGTSPHVWELDMQSFH